jgi:nucleoid-associated protein YgaU
VLRNLQVREDPVIIEAALDLSPSVQLLEMPRARVEVLIQFGIEGPGRAEPETRNYLVRKGDTLFLIGRRYGVSVEALLRANNLDPASPILPGQSLRIPPGS